MIFGDFILIFAKNVSFLLFMGTTKTVENNHFLLHIIVEQSGHGGDDILIVNLIWDVASQ